jgi:hypothetical protein
MKLQRLTLEEFDRLVSSTRMQEATRAMARAVLVDGRSQAEVANELGMTRQRVNLAVAAIERVYAATAGAGDGNVMVRVSLDLPEGLAVEMGTFVDALSKCSDPDLANEAIDKAVAGVRSATKRLK